MWGILALVAAVALAAPPLVVPGAPDEALPEGCRAEAAGFLCEWRTSTRDAAGGLATQSGSAGRSSYEVPTLERMLITITVTLEGAHGGWRIYVHETDEAGEPMGNLVYRRAARGTTGELLHQDASVHYAAVAPGASAVFIFWPYAFSGEPDGLVSLGEARITYRVEPVPEGAPPAVPAATFDDPHLRDDTGDTARPWLDVRAFWLGDEALGDGLMDAHLAVADLASMPDDLGPGELFYSWDGLFTVQGHRYVLRWLQPRACDGPNPECVLPTGQGLGERRCHLLRYVEGEGGVPLTSPSCTVDVASSTLHATFPESVIGAPAAGTPFHEMGALAGRQLAPMSDRKEGVDDGSDGFVRDDVASGERFPFALGGPDVWCQHRPASCVAPVAWYRAPLAPENVPNTLQVLGALFAIGAFLIGLVLVRARRRRVRALLAEVEAVVARHHRDASAGLLALGELEGSFDARLKRGAISDAEYQIVSQRIATSATRLAMRRDLGLDDGAPDVRLRVR